MVFAKWGIYVVVGTAVWLFTVGWRRSSTKNTALLPNRWRIVAFLAAMLVLLVALASPLHTLAARYFSFHVLQRLLLVAVVPSLFLVGIRYLFCWRGFPKSSRPK